MLGSEVVARNSLAALEQITQGVLVRSKSLLACAGQPLGSTSLIARASKPLSARNLCLKTFETSAPAAFSRTFRAKSLLGRTRQPPGA